MTFSHGVCLLAFLVLTFGFIVVFHVQFFELTSLQIQFILIIMISVGNF